MTRPDPGQDRALGLILLLLWAVWTARIYLGDWAPDLSAIYFAARFYGQGLFDLIYASPERFFGDDQPVEWTAELVALGHAGNQTYPYVYPPLWAAIFSPIAVRMDPVAFFSAIWVVQIGLMVASAGLAYRIMRPAMSYSLWSAITVVLLGTSIISFHALFHNQPQIAVAFLSLLAFERLSAGKPAAAGLALGLAAAFKLTPILLVLIFLSERQFRASLIAFTVAGGLALISLIVTGPALHVQFLEKLSLVSEQLIIWDFNYSIHAVLWQLGEIAANRPMPPPETSRPIVTLAPAWLGLTATASLLAGGALLIRATRALPAPDRLRRRIVAGFLLITLASPLSWTHQYLFALFLLPGLIGILPPARGALVLVIFGVLFSTLLAPRVSGLIDSLNLETLAGVVAMALLALIFALAPTRRTNVPG